MEADTRRMPPRHASTRPYVMTNHWGIVKADIGLKGSRTVAIGKAGNPDVMPGVDIASARAPKSSPPRE